MESIESYLMNSYNYIVSNFKKLCVGINKCYSWGDEWSIGWIYATIYRKK
ncbi:hypothetical protein [Methanocaldococcus fervens]|nr:hypothetical protein [Methanocaldococcus fervens]